MSSKKLLEMAEHQFVGFSHARAGYSVEELATGMGLTKKEWEKIRDKVRLSPRDENDLDQYFEDKK